jgi:hypothetical protein
VAIFLNMAKKECTNICGSLVSVKEMYSLPTACLYTFCVLHRIRRLNRKDCVIIWGGSNDINKNETSTGLKHHEFYITESTHKYYNYPCFAQARFD